jgi:hypothetical protein
MSVEHGIHVKKNIENQQKAENTCIAEPKI